MAKSVSEAFSRLLWENIVTGERLADNIIYRLLTKLPEADVIEIRVATWKEDESHPEWEACKR
jgi:hypothetical protein